MRKTFHTFILLTILPVALIDNAHAQDTELYVGGFASQGFVVSSANSYLVKNSVDGSFEMNEAALTVQATPYDRLRIGIQFLARDLGDIGNNQVIIDWAGLDYRWRDQLGIRAGKVKMPLGFYNQGRDIDFLRTNILLPQSVYSEQQRDFVLAHEGVSIYGNLCDPGTGYIDYELFCGTLTVPDPTVGFWGDNFEASGRSYQQVYQQVLAQYYGVDTSMVAVDFAGVNDHSVTFPIIYGGALTWNTPLQGLRFGTSWAISEFDMYGRWGFVANAVDSAGTLHNLAESVETKFEFEIDQLYTVSAEYIRGPWNFSAEYNSIILDQADQGSNREEGYYGRVSYRFNPLITAGTYYSLYYGDAGDHDGSSVREAGGLDFGIWEKDLALSMRLDLNENWILKGEYHYIDGLALQSAVDIRERYTLDQVDRYWSTFLLKTTVHF